MTSALLFAAGFGTRMAPLTETLPKPLVRVAGVPLIDHAIALARDGGLTELVANLHYRSELIEAHLAGSGVQCLVEWPDILDTGGGLKNALPLLGSGPVITLNTDAVWQGPSPVRRLREAWRPGHMEGLLLLMPGASALCHDGEGDFVVDVGGRLKPGPGAVYTGLQMIRTDRLADMDPGRFSMWELWRPMIGAGSLYGLCWDGHWCDVGKPEAIAAAEEMLGNVRD